MIIPLQTVVYDERARDGTWCRLPYPPNHQNGCPNYPKCIEKREDFRDLGDYDWYAVIEMFDLRSHDIKMGLKHGWKSRFQRRNRRHWQKQGVSKLHNKAKKFAYGRLGSTIILDIPEANGVNVFATMAKHGIFLSSDPDLVYKIMMVGVQ